MKNISKIFTEKDMMKLGAVKHVTLKDNDQINLRINGEFNLYRYGHHYIIDENLKDILNNSRPLSAIYLGEVKEMDEKDIRKTVSFSKLREDYNFIKDSPGEGK